MPGFGDNAKMGIFPYDPRYRPVAAPETGIFDAPLVQICVNERWVGHIDGLLERLLWPDAWAGDDTEKLRATNEVVKLVASLLLRNPCGEGDMACCDELLEEIRLLRKEQQEPIDFELLRQIIGGLRDNWYGRWTQLETTYGGDPSGFYTQLQYDGGPGDATRDNAMCFMTRRFVDLICDWVIKNIDLKVANQQTTLNVASAIADFAGFGASLLANTAFGPGLASIEFALDSEVNILTGWITNVSAAARAAFADDAARKEVACNWWDALKGSFPTEASFRAALAGISTSTSNAATIKLKMLDAMVSVEVAQQPSNEKAYYIFSDLWNEAYGAAAEGIIGGCSCGANIELVNIYSPFDQEPEYKFVRNTATGGSVWDIEYRRAANQQVFINAIRIGGGCFRVVSAVGSMEANRSALCAGGLDFDTPVSEKEYTIIGFEGPLGAFCRIHVEEPLP